MGERRGLESPAWPALIALALAKLVVTMAFAGRYGWHRDMVMEGRAYPQAESNRRFSLERAVSWPLDDGGAGRANASKANFRAAGFAECVLGLYSPQRVFSRS